MDLQSTGRGFESRPLHHRMATTDKSFTQYVPSASEVTTGCRYRNSVTLIFKNKNSAKRIIRTELMVEPITSEDSCPPWIDHRCSIKAAEATAERKVESYATLLGILSVTLGTKTDGNLLSRRLATANRSSASIRR